MMTAYLDETAERTVTGVAVATAHGAGNEAAGPARPEHFYDPRYARLYTAALACGLFDHDDRVHDLSIETGEHPAWINDIAWSRCVLHDDGWVYARRVVAAHAHRQTVAAHLEALEELGLAVTARQLR
jgi:hypothetical protein